MTAPPTLRDSPFLQLSLLPSLFSHEAPLQTHQGMSCLPYLFPSENPNFNSFSHCSLTFIHSTSLGAQRVLGCPREVDEDWGVLGPCQALGLQERRVPAPRKSGL